MLALQGGERLGERVVGETVGLGGDDEEGALALAEEVDELAVAGLGRNVAVHQADAEGEGLALGEVGLDELRPFRGDGLGDFGVAVAGQVGEDERGARFLAPAPSWRAKKLMARVRPGVDEVCACFDPAVH